MHGIASLVPKEESIFAYSGESCLSFRSITAIDSGKAAAHSDLFLPLHCTDPKAKVPLVRGITFLVRRTAPTTPSYAELE
jgi:hypothetical protein